jgi:hypothetical protein
VRAPAGRQYLHVAVPGQGRELRGHDVRAADLLVQGGLAQDDGQLRAIFDEGGLAFGFGGYRVLSLSPGGVGGFCVGEGAGVVLSLRTARGYRSAGSNRKESNLRLSGTTTRKWRWSVVRISLVS